MNREAARAEIARLEAILDREPKAGELWKNPKFTKDTLRLIVEDEDGELVAVSPTTFKYKGRESSGVFDNYEFVRTVQI